MKKGYQRPETWVTDNVFLNIMGASQQTPWVEGKEADTPWDYIDDEEQDSKFSWSVWGDEDEEEDI